MSEVRKVHSEELPRLIEDIDSHIRGLVTFRRELKALIPMLQRAAYVRVAPQSKPMTEYKVKQIKRYLNRWRKPGEQPSMSLQRIADLCGVNQARVSEVEKGKYNGQKI